MFHSTRPTDTAPGHRPLSVLLVDDHPLLLQGLAAILQGQPGISIVGEARDGRQAVELVKRIEPDVVVMDLVMPEMDGVQATRAIVECCPNTRIIGLSCLGQGRTIRDAIEAGMNGYMPKRCAVDELVEAVRAVGAGGSYISPLVRRGDLQDGPELSPRELEVLRLLAAGKATKEVATELGLSVKTVETHRTSLREKLGIHSIAELTKYALREGMTSLG
jgi:DNA-binding NarL/FixJ family response regulator